MTNAINSTTSPSATSPFMSRIHSIDEDLTPYTADAVRTAFLDRPTPPAAPPQALMPTGYQLPDAIAEGARNSELLKIAGHMRGKGLEQEVIEQALLGINQSKCTPPLDDSEVIGIAGRYIASGEATTGEWLPFSPIPDSLPEAAPFNPQEMLPQSLAPFVEDVAERMQCPVDYVGISLMIACGSLLGSKIGVRPKQFDPWHEVPNLWGIIIGASGVKKTPAIEAAISPLREVQRLADEQYEQGMDQYRFDKLQFESRLAAKKKAYAKGQQPLTPQDMIPPEIPGRRRYLLNDATPEAIGVILQNNIGPLVFSDEITGVLSKLEGEENRAARAFYLSAYNGKHGFTVDRITREAVTIPRLCLSLLGSTQPDVLRGYLRHAGVGASGNDGLVQRFQLSVFPEKPPKPIFIDRSPDTEAERIARNVFITLNNLDPATIGAAVVSGSQIPVLGFDPAVQPRVNQWLENFDQALYAETVSPALNSHLSKFRKTIPSLALILHLAGDGTGPISMLAWEMAKKWAKYLASHARKIYAVVNRAPYDDARSLGRKIRQKKLNDGFTLRQVYQHGWAGLSDKNVVKDALDILEDCGWVCCTRETTGGRPTDRYWINPEIYKR